MVALKPRDRTPEGKTTFAFALLLAICREAREPPDLAKKTIVPRLSCRASRWINGAFGLFYGGAIAAVTLLLHYQPVQPPPSAPVLNRQKTHLPFDYLVSDDFLNWQEEYQREKLASLVRDAEADRLLAADDLREAKTLKVIADQGLAASILNKGSGEPVRTTTTVLVSCEDQGDLGWTAGIQQLEANSPYQTFGSIGNLAECFVGVVEAGGVVGTAGDFGVSVRE